MVLTFLLGLASPRGWQSAVACILGMTAFSLLLDFALNPDSFRHMTAPLLALGALLQIPLVAAIFYLGRICMYVYEERQADKLAR